MKLATLILGSVSIAIQFYAKKYYADDVASTAAELVEDKGLPRIKTYDFIVVGGGSAGCLVAGRLSETFNVLLLEAGGDPVPAAEVPYFVREVAADPDINYFFYSVPQANASLNTGGVIRIETGKMLGGSGSHNDLVHNRGSPLDYDNYARITNDDSWNYTNVLEYFKKSENFIGQVVNPGEQDYYGRDGPLTVDTEIPLILPKWFQVADQLGFRIGDPNGYQVESFTPNAKLIENGTRVSTYNRFIRPYRGVRPTLTVIPFAVVSQILINNNNQAYGVQYTRHGIPQIAHASKEVILSAGTFISPLILMQSGIGPEAVLREAEIPVKLNLPGVGDNLSDHVFLWLLPITFNSSAVPYFPRVPEDQFESLLKTYQETGSGVFGELQEGPQAFFVSERAKASGEGDWPDNRLTFDSSCPTSFEDGQGPSACFWITLDRARSKGFVTLNTTAFKLGATDFTELALIDFKMLEDPSDVEVLMEGIKYGLRIIEETTPFMEMGATYAATPEPNCSQFVYRSDDYWRCYIRHISTTTIHMVGTCSMGQGTMAVTDSKFRVKGISGLRVVDASVLPETPNSNLNAPVIMLAEKASADIINTHLVK